MSTDWLERAHKARKELNDHMNKWIAQRKTDMDYSTAKFTDLDADIGMLSEKQLAGGINQMRGMINIYNRTIISQEVSK